jgi:hypothetical protein
MMKLKKLILVFSSAFLLFQCKSNEEKDQVIAPDFKFNTPSPNFSLHDAVDHNAAIDIYGIWKYLSQNIFYSAELKINPNGTFEYSDHSCLGKRYANGTWYRAGVEIILESLPKQAKSTAQVGDTTFLFFENNRFRFERGSLYELQKDGSISQYIQTENYR